MISYLYAALIAVGTLVIGILLGIWIRKRAAKRAEEKISNADEEALRIVNEAIKSAESKKREVMLEAKEDILRSRNEYEKEVKERRAEQQKQERRLQQKEENLDRKTDALEKREETLNQKHAAMDKENEEIKIIKRSQTEMLERISGFTAEDAKKYLIEQVESEVTHETALKIKELEQRAKDEADSRAREIVASAIQRCAADHVAEITVSVVPLPNDEMKGRIIGREGPQHPHDRNAHGRRSHHRRHARGHHRLVLRARAPAKLRAWRSKSSSPTAASIPPTLRRWSTRPAARWTPSSRLRASAPCWRPASAACTPSL